MGPYPLPAPDEPPELGTDQVKRAHAFIAAHPYVAITSPRENGTGEWIASWRIPAADPGEAPVIGKATHYMLAWLMNYLEARRWPEGTA